MNNESLCLAHVEKTLGSKKILSDVSFSINENEIVGLLGPNGAGKTTAFYIAAGLVFPDHGKVFINSTDVTKDPMHVRSVKGLGYLPQEASIFSDLSVENNLMGIAELSNGDKDQAINIVKKIIDEFDLKNILQVKGRMLSGGQRRKVEIARTLICKPKIMLLDEPFAGIDPIAVEEIKELLKEICKKEISILITDHNVRETLSLCHKAIILSDGKIIAEGNEESLKENAHVQKKYFGKMFS
jgi:lipopolysaccharide export system ATP-binding protein